MDVALSDHTVVVARNDQVSCSLGEDIVLLDLKAGLYFSLNSVGAAVWQQLRTPTTVRDIRQSILDQFEVTEDVCRRDLVTLLQELASRNLIEIRDGAAA